MKRFISAILMLIMMFCLFGCTAKDKNDTVVPDTEITSEDAPPISAQVHKVEKDYIILGLSNGSYGVRIDMDTSNLDLEMYDVITLKDNLKALEKKQKYTYGNYNNLIVVGHTARAEDIIDFGFDPDNIDGEARVLSKDDGYLIVNYKNRAIIVKSENYNRFSKHDLISICGDATLLDTPIDYTIQDRQTQIKYEVVNANVNGIYVESEDGPMLAYKPVIYLYPEKPTDVNVSVNIDGHLTCVYPEYDGLWQVNAKPDGTLTDKRGREYYCLYWEGDFDKAFDIDKSVGFVVKGKDTAEFLRKKALILGLTEKEANEFIIYWLPQMEKNEYNYIYFALDEYEKRAELKVNPAPDTQIRFMMLFKPLNKKIEVKEQILPKTPERKGFCLVEWGGSKIK